MIRKVQNTFDWEVLVRCLAAASVLYVVGAAALHGGFPGTTPTAGLLAGN
jgi:hypothetical protein